MNGLPGLGAIPEGDTTYRDGFASHWPTSVIEWDMRVIERDGFRGTGRARHAALARELERRAT